jgi:hypothetical protein
VVCGVGITPQTSRRMTVGQGVLTNPETLQQLRNGWGMSRGGVRGGGRGGAEDWPKRNHWPFVEPTQGVDTGPVGRGPNPETLSQLYRTLGQVGGHT